MGCPVLFLLLGLVGRGVQASMGLHPAAHRKQNAGDIGDR